MDKSILTNNNIPTNNNYKKSNNSITKHSHCIDIFDYTNSTKSKWSKCTLKVFKTISNISLLTQILCGIGIVPVTVFLLPKSEDNDFIATPKYLIYMEVILMSGYALSSLTRSSINAKIVNMNIKNNTNAIKNYHHNLQIINKKLNKLNKKFINMDNKSNQQNIS